MFSFCARGETARAKLSDDRLHVFHRQPAGSRSALFTNRHDLSSFQKIWYTSIKKKKRRRRRLLLVEDLPVQLCKEEKSGKISLVYDQLITTTGRWWIQQPQFAFPIAAGGEISAIKLDPLFDYLERQFASIIYNSCCRLLAAVPLSVCRWQSAPSFKKNGKSRWCPWGLLSSRLLAAYDSKRVAPVNSVISCR